MIDDLPLKKLDRMLDQIKESMLGGSVNRYEKDLEGAGEAATGMATKTGKATKETKKLGSTADQASEDARALGNEVERTSTRMQRLGSAARGIGNGLGSAISRLHAYTNGFERLRKESASAIGSIRGGLLSLGSSALKMPFSLPAAVVGGTIGYGAVSGTGKALKLAGEKENALLAMSFFGGSEERGQSIYDQIVNFAATTPYGLNFTREQSTGLMGMYKGMAGDAFDPDQMIGSTMRTLRAFGDAAGLTGAGEGGADRALLGFRQIGTIGKLQLEELRQVTENLLVPMELVRKELGLTKEEMASIGDLNIDAEKAMNAILRALEKNFGGGMEKLSKTMLGMTSQLKDTWQLSITAIGDGMAVPVKRILTDLVGTTDFTSDEFKKFESRLRGFGTYIGSAFESIYKEVKVRGSAAFEYIRRNYLENEEFQQLPFNKKIDYVLGDIKRQFDGWFDADGRRMIESGAQKFVEYTISTVDQNLPVLGSMGLDVGLSLGKGMADGLQQYIIDHPVLSMLFGAGVGAMTGMRFGWWGAAAGAAAGGIGALGFGSGVFTGNRDISNKPANSMFIKSPELPSVSNNQNTIPANPIDRVNAVTMGQFAEIPGFATGLSNVPYDNFLARLHQGERVLTAEENKRYSFGVNDEQIEALNRTERIMAGEGRRSMSQGATSNAGMGAFSPTINQSFVVNGGEPGRVEREARNGTIDAWEDMWRSLGRRNPVVTEY
jgi:tape measure domain-containing protein